MHAIVITNKIIMKKKVQLAVLALLMTTAAMAQVKETDPTVASGLDENAFTFTEAQLGEDDDMSQNVTILNSANNVYAAEVSYLFSPMRFRYRAFNQKYNDIYVNGAPLNDMETGQFRFTNVGGLNRFTRNVDFALPFEGNMFAMNGMAGSNNYNFRAGEMPAGNYASVGVANRNYTLRGMYTYASGFNKQGWAIAAGITYRWANQGYVEGTFYNSLSYFFGVQKKWFDSGHSLAFSTWGNPTERSNQGAATDEAYWLANDYYYNPYWGYQNGHKRNSRVVNDFAPSAVLTWDWEINDKMKLTTSVFGKYSMYKSTKLNYSNAENPHPDYWKNMPSSYYDVWGDESISGTSSSAYSQWLNSYNYWTASKANRQINWDRLYWANQQAAAQGYDALYYVEAKHIDNIMVNMASTLTSQVTKNSKLASGLILAHNKGHHYKTMEDLLGASTYHNINTYALGDYTSSDPAIQYDLNTAGPNNTGKLVYEGDTFEYDYDILVQKMLLWSTYVANIGSVQAMISGKLGQTDMRRNGHMRNGLCADYSYGKSPRAHMGEGGAKGSLSWDAGYGHVFKLGAGYEWRPPSASTAFVSPEMNNDFVSDLSDEHIFSSEFSYQYQNAWLHANINAYFSYLDHVTEWQSFYDDTEGSYTYISMSGIKKKYYGVEAGLDFKLASFLNLKAIGTISDARNVNNSKAYMMNSTSTVITEETVLNKNMREASTPLTATSVGLSFHQNGWFIDLNANYYDRIYLSYAPNLRYVDSPDLDYDNDGNASPRPQAKGHGGWMLDGSIGKSIRLKKGSLNFNFTVTNILNNQSIVTGGYEQSRSDYSNGNERTYLFSQNPKKYYVYGTNGMFQVSYRF